MFTRFLVALVICEANVDVAVVVAFLFAVLEDAFDFVVGFFDALTWMPRFDVPLQISPAHEHLPAELAPVGRVSLRVQSDVFVEIARIAKGPKTHFTFEWFVACVGPHVNLQPVFSRVQFATV